MPLPSKNSCANISKLGNYNDICAAADSASASASASVSLSVEGFSTLTCTCKSYKGYCVDDLSTSCPAGGCVGNYYICKQRGDLITQEEFDNNEELIKDYETTEVNNNWLKLEQTELKEKLEDESITDDERQELMNKISKNDSEIAANDKYLEDNKEAYEKAYDDKTSDSDCADALENIPDVVDVYPLSSSQIDQGDFSYPNSAVYNVNFRLNAPQRKGAVGVRPYYVYKKNVKPCNTSGNISFYYEYVPALCSSFVCEDLSRFKLYEAPKQSNNSSTCDLFSDDWEEIAVIEDQEFASDMRYGVLDTESNIFYPDAKIRINKHISSNIINTYHRITINDDYILFANMLNKDNSMQIPIHNITLPTASFCVLDGQAYDLVHEEGGFCPGYDEDGNCPEIDACCSWGSGHCPENPCGYSCDCHYCIPLDTLGCTSDFGTRICDGTDIPECSIKTVLSYEDIELRLEFLYLTSSAICDACNFSLSSSSSSSFKSTLEERKYCIYIGDKPNF